MDRPVYVHGQSGTDQSSGGDHVELPPHRARSHLPFWPAWGCAGLPAPAEAQRSDRATISGVVTDAQGAGVPGATVTIRNEDTGVESVQVTNESGAYTPPPLVLGRYTVTVDLQGFKKSVTTGILLQGGDAIPARRRAAGRRR